MFHLAWSFLIARDPTMTLSLGLNNAILTGSHRGMQHTAVEFMEEYCWLKGRLVDILLESVVKRRCRLALASLEGG